MDSLPEPHWDLYLGDQVIILGLMGHPVLSGGLQQCTTDGITVHEAYYATW